MVREASQWKPLSMQDDGAAVACVSKRWKFLTGKALTKDGVPPVGGYPSRRAVQGLSAGFEEVGRSKFGTLRLRRGLRRFAGRCPLTPKCIVSLNSTSLPYQFA